SSDALAVVGVDVFYDTVRLKVRQGKQNTWGNWGSAATVKHPMVALNDNLQQLAAMANAKVFGVT
ncbi:MAG: hypothetical protein FD134_2535, partial [Gallionellaceae bacterium]